MQKHIQAASLEFLNKSLKAFISRGTKGPLFYSSLHFYCHNISIFSLLQDGSYTRASVVLRVIYGRSGREYVTIFEFSLFKADFNTSVCLI